MTCKCGGIMKKHERIVDWEKQRWWECEVCHDVKPIERKTSEDDTHKEGR